MEELNIYFRGTCDLFSIKQVLPHQLWDGATADGGTSFLATRLIHNKPVILTTDLLRCYLLPLDLFFLAQISSIVVVFILLLGFFLSSKRLRLFYIPILIFPLLFILSSYFPVALTIHIYQLYLYLLVAFVVIFLVHKKFFDHAL